MGMKETLDKLIENAMMPNNEIAVRDLLETMDKIEIGILKEAAPAFDQLCVSWEEEITKSDDKANICVHLAELSIVDTPSFRGPLNAAIRKLLPPYLASGAVIKAIGARDENTSAHDAALRLRPSRVAIELPGTTWEDAGEDRSAQHFAITLLDALCAALS